MLIDHEPESGTLYVQLSPEHREPAVERWVAPGVRVGLGERGEVLMVEIFGDEAAQAGR